jgi:hypothetical protein
LRAEVGRSGWSRFRQCVVYSFISVDTPDESRLDQYKASRCRYL